MSAAADRPVTILIAALGGEGGGVLSDWLIEAATAGGYPVQGTSIPGVAQRTGATTYYLEIFPAPTAQLGGRRPVLALTPSPGNVDVMLASELIEAGRAMQNGFISRDRTMLIASNHRIYAIGEKSAMGDGRYDGARVERAAAALAKRPLLFDMARAAQRAGSVISAVMFGAMAGSGALPLPRALCEDVIRKSGKAVEANLRGFAAGFDRAAGTAPAEEIATPVARTVTPSERLCAEYPTETHAILSEGVARLIDYQDAAYADQYLDRLAPILAAERAAGGTDYRVTAETGRHLALWMSFEDIIRVADLKTRPERFARVRTEVKAKPDEPVIVVDYLKPGLAELCSILPPRLADRVMRWAKARGIENRLNLGLYVKSTSINGFLAMHGLSRLKPWRRKTARFAAEQALIERWLGVVGRAAARDLDLALEIAVCARLVKGYGDTHRRGTENFLRILDTLTEPGLASAEEPSALAAAIRAARDAALADPEGRALDHALRAPAPRLAEPASTPMTIERPAAE